MMQLWDRKHGQHVHTTCVQPFTPYKKKKSHLKVRCVAREEELTEMFCKFLIALAVGSWIAFGVMFVRWWLGC